MSPLLRPGMAERLWEASRVEFSLRGYHGARVQGIAHRAGCNVALLYRHWNSKQALYLEVLRSVWQGMLSDVIARVATGGGPAAVVGAYLDANMRDAMAARILIREFLDGGPFLSQLLAAEPALAEPLRRMARTLAAGSEAQAFRASLDPMVAVLSIGGLAALVASARDAARPLLADPVAPEKWRTHTLDLLLQGIVAGPAADDASRAPAPHRVCETGTLPESASTLVCPLGDA